MVSFSARSNIVCNVNRFITVYEVSKAPSGQGMNRLHTASTSTRGNKQLTDKKTEWPTYIYFQAIMMRPDNEENILES